MLVFKKLTLQYNSIGKVFKLYEYFLFKTMNKDLYSASI